MSERRERERERTCREKGERKKSAQQTRYLRRPWRTSTIAAEEMPSTHRVTTAAGGFSDVENRSRERETEAHTQGERPTPPAGWVKGSGLPRPRVARGDRGTARDNDPRHGAGRQTPARRSRHAAMGAPGATGLGHGTMTPITGRCGRHRHNVSLRRVRPITGF